MEAGASRVLPVDEKSASVSISDSLELLGTRYSPRLHVLYDHVVADYKKPIRIETVFGDVDNQIETHGPEIVLRLKAGSSEDNVAHELMHAVLQTEGFPQVAAVAVLPLAVKVRSMMGGDFDHLIINERLLVLGYDAKAGFLSKAASFESILKLSVPSEPDARAIFDIAMLHELMKFRIYQGSLAAEVVIVQTFPEVKPYWAKLLERIRGLPKEPKPRDTWQVVRTYIRVGDDICSARKASFRLSDLLIFEPVLVPQGNLEKPAATMFEERLDDLGQGHHILRTFLSEGGIMVAGRANVSLPLIALKVDLGLPVREFADRRDISIWIEP